MSFEKGKTFPPAQTAFGIKSTRIAPDGIKAIASPQPGESAKVGKHAVGHVLGHR